MAARFQFECPVCRAPVKARTFRRHVRRLHGEEVPRDFARGAWARFKEQRRIDRSRPVYGWFWRRESMDVIAKAVAFWSRARAA